MKDNKFNVHAIKLVNLSIALDLKDGFKVINVEDICWLMKKMYFENSTKQKEKSIGMSTKALLDWCLSRFRCAKFDDKYLAVWRIIQYLEDNPPRWEHH